MISRLLAALLIFSSFTGIVKEELIPWKAERKLTWADFKGAPDKGSGNAALTSSSIGFGWNYGEKGFSYNITCTFDKNQSWGRIKNDLILAHEQAHFDITELHARKLNKALKEYQFKEKTGSKDINAIYSGLMNDLFKMQTLYDKESDHSRNLPKQKEWLLIVEKELNSMKDYAGYH